MCQLQTLKKKGAGTTRCRITDRRAIITKSTEHFIIGWFPHFGFFIPYLLNDLPLRFGYSLTGYLLKPVQHLPNRSRGALGHIPGYRQVRTMVVLVIGVAPLVDFLSIRDAQTVEHPLVDQFTDCHSANASLTRFITNLFSVRSYLPQIP